MATYRVYYTVPQAAGRTTLPRECITDFFGITKVEMAGKTAILWQHPDAYDVVENCEYAEKIA